MSSTQPIFLFELTQRCEYKCNPCLENILVADQHVEMRLWEWLIIIESIAEQQGKLIIAGGDPFLRQDLYDIISYAKVLGVDVELATCGINLSPDRLEGLKKNGVDSVIVRLDGITRDENDSFRGVRSYDEALEAIRLIKEFEMKASLVINSDVDSNKLEQAYTFSRENSVPLFIATKSWRGAPSLIRSRKLEKLDNPSEKKIQGAIIDPEGKVFQLRETGVQFSGDIHTKRYRVPEIEQ